MSPHIELDDDVFDYLKMHAEPFVDTPSSVMRRLLGIAASANATGPTVSSAAPSSTGPRITSTGSKPTQATKKRPTKAASSRRARAAPGTLLPEVRYERPLLKALTDAGGQAPYREVAEAVGQELKGQLLPADFENLSSGSVRWQSRLQFVRLRLIERGYLDKNAPRGVWGITDEGRAALANGEG